MFGTERTTSLPVFDAPIKWNGPGGLNEENFPTTMPDLHEIEPYQQPYNPLLFHLIHQEGLSQCHSLPNLTSSSSTLTKSTHIRYTNPHASPSSVLEQNPHGGNNMFALPQSHLSETQSSSIQALAPTSLPGLGLTYQPNEDAQIPGDMDDILPNAEQEDWQMESDQRSQIILGNGNPDRHEATGVNQEAKVTGINVGYKSRMRWTQELHESFVQAVNNLGEATPKSIQIEMGVPGLTIYHIKSHLQITYKQFMISIVPVGLSDTGYLNVVVPGLDHDFSDKRPSCSEGKRRNATEDGGAPKMSSKDSETLHAQLELQKALHEQLKIIKELQLQAEESGRCLQKFMEDRYKEREAFFHATQSMSMTKGVATEGTSAPFSSDKLLVSLDEDLMKDDMLSDLARNDVSTDAELVASPTSKRARIDAESSKATISSNVFQL
ncbi:myb family transcription factor PHL5-like [Cocos nucifera]|uniref:Myb family transcription factor PHL5-like n=1 Tax=Cocos nucifera TaxID=13894 RepID=A0A8K0IIK9_COCNU|nr:myb family transcription factor PHL5-like [Cocos nucifera]